MRYWVLLMLLICAGCARTSKVSAPVTAMPVQPYTGMASVSYHKVARGETLWRIARMYGMEVDDLAALNRIQDATKLETGQQVAVPGGRKKQFASAQSAADDFIWPLKGTVIARFSQSSEKTANKGVNIRPVHSPEVVAAAGGRVVFCHDDFLDLGKTIILEHAGGFWTVYGRNSEVYVKVGDQIQRGKVIASAGSAGRDPAVYLHFEIRKGSLPQNPAFYLP
jgi:murein DD-endopeptidase MepM/ murein hydrolase activator NlpD